MNRAVLLVSDLLFTHANAEHGQHMKDAQGHGDFIHWFVNCRLGVSDLGI